jgi:hypothetical protein
MACVEARCGSLGRLRTNARRFESFVMPAHFFAYFYAALSPFRLLLRKG